MLSGGYALAFPSFGPERRGAPMRAFTKLADSQISDRSEITSPTFTVYLDETLAPPAAEENTFVPSPEDYALAGQFRLPTINTVMLARLAKGLDFSREIVIAAVFETMPEKIRQKNADAVSEVFK
jgi:pyruvate ferredoxin oxidoreductase gamma subunit